VTDWKEKVPQYVVRKFEFGQLRNQTSRNKSKSRIFAAKNHGFEASLIVVN
jgi:hypothetical protein